MTPDISVADAVDARADVTDSNAPDSNEVGETTAIPPVCVPAAPAPAAPAPAAPAPALPTTVPAVAAPVPPLGLAVTAAGAVASVVGLVSRVGASDGSLRHDGGAMLVVAGLAVVVAGVLWQLAPYVQPLVAGRAGGAPGRRPMRWLAVAVAVGAALVLGVTIGQGRRGDPQGSTAPTPTAPIPTAPAATSTVAPDPNGAGDTTDGQPSIGAVLAAQGQGTNTPPPSIPGVSFPVGDARNSSTDASPWSTTPLMPLTVPPTPLNGTAATDPPSAPSTTTPTATPTTAPAGAATPTTAAR